jgi:hypothetical protein
MKSTFSDTITLVGAAGGQAYLTIFPNVQTTLTGGPYTDDGPPSAEGTYSSTTLVSYNQPINLTETLTTHLQTGNQSGTLNDPVSGSETLVATDQIELLITATPPNMSGVYFSLPPSYTLQSDLGVDYDVLPISLAPEPNSTSLVWISIIGLIPVAVRRNYGSRNCRTD